MKLWFNANFYSMKDSKTKYDKVLTNKGVIIAVGDDCDNYHALEKIDLKGAYVYPGFTDSHMHLLGYGRKLSSNNLLLNKNKEEVLKLISSMFKEDTLKVEGYYNIGITKDDLDLISRDHLIILRHNDYHSFTVNSKVLKLTNLTNSNGIITNEQEASLIKPYYENSSKEELINYGINAIDSLHKNGFTSIHTDDLSYFNSYLETVEILNDLSKNKKLRINTLIHYKILNNYLKYYPTNNNLLKDIQVKLFYDGTLSSKTAYLNSYYKNTLNNGIKMFEDKELKELVKKIRKNDKGLAIHVIGDKGLDEVVSLINKTKRKGVIDRIVHASLASTNVLSKIGNTAIDIQPLFIKSDEDFINKNIAHDVLVYPFKEYLKESIILNSSSDAPVEDINPILSIYELLKVGLNNFEAVKSYTINPYLTINQKGGLIEKGYYADFTVFNKDILKISQNELLQTKVKYTIIDDEVVYKKV